MRERKHFANGVITLDEKEISQTDSKSGWKDYLVHQYPPWHVCLLASFQQLLATLSGPVTNCYIIWSHLCAPDNGILYAELISTTLFLGGVCTILQETLGIRLPVVQQSSSSFLPVVISTMATPKWKCPEIVNNGTLNSSTIAPNLEYEEAWKPRLLVLSGSLCVASAVELALGCTGLLGYLLKFIGPMTIIPTVALVGLSLFSSATASAEHQWGIAMMVVGIIILCGFVLDKVQVPFPCYRKSKGCYSVTYPVFKLFPHLIAVGLAWLLCYILTITDVFPSNPDALQYLARTDVKTGVIDEAEWWFWPYPGRLGLPTVDAGVFAGMLAATLTSVIESVGDYYATASICGTPSPPKHAVSRGIAMEGFSGILAGLLYAGHGSTSYSSTVGFIGITGIKSRIVWVAYGILLLACGCFGKVGAALSIVPEPILGGLTVVAFGMLISVGLSNLKHVDATSPRNMIIIGVSIMIGMMLPAWLADNPGIINTGNVDADQFLTVTLSTPMFVGGVLACLLDNIIPGSAAERGIHMLSQKSDDLDDNADELTKKTYDLPWISDALRRIKCCTYVPFLPSYVERKINCCHRHSPNADSHSNMLKDEDLVTKL